MSEKFDNDYPLDTIYALRQICMELKRIADALEEANREANRRELECKELAKMLSEHPAGEA